MKVGIVGSGISGLSAGWLLSEKYDVHLFESASRLGGHAHTVDAPLSDGTIPVDTGFLVYNELTYPNLIAFFDALGVETIASDMSLSVMAPHRSFEWSGTNLNTIFGQRRNLLRPKFYRMLLDILRFGRDAEKNLRLSRRHGWSLGELLLHRRYSNAFIDDYLLPIGAAIWSTPEGEMKNFPAETFLTFFMNHKLLQVNDRPVWRTVKNGSRNYVEKAALKIPRVCLNAEVSAAERVEGKVILTVNGEGETFDYVILATHASDALRILQKKTPQEIEILGAISFEKNETILHQDPSVMPKIKRCWSSWNVFGTKTEIYSDKVSLTYYINRLQSLSTKDDVFVTLNPHKKIHSPFDSFTYEHPKFDRAAIRAQRELSKIQGHGGVFFAGAWTRYGFHEDGILSAINVARLLNVQPPWETQEK